MRVSSIFPLLLLASTPSLGAQSVARGWPLDPTGAVKIFNDVGSIRIVGWLRDSVHVTGTGNAPGTFFGGGGRSGVKMGIESKPGAIAKPTDLVVHVPVKARVWVKSAAANVVVTDFSGPVDAGTVGGNVTIHGTPTEVRAETMNGTIDLIGSPAYLRLKTATGRISWTGTSEDALLSTVSGTIMATAVTVTRARFESIDGEIRFSGGVTKDASAVFDTHSGDIVMLLRRDTAAELEVSAIVSELFGAKSSTVGTGPPRASIFRTLGKPGESNASIVVRSFKGHVTASMRPQ